MTVAERGPSSMSATSPKDAPGPSSAITRSPCVALAVPDSMTKNPMPLLPSAAMTSPALNVRSLNEPAIRSSSFLSTFSKRRTCCRRSTSSLLALSPSSCPCRPRRMTGFYAEGSRSPARAQSAPRPCPPRRRAARGRLRTAPRRAPRARSPRRWRRHRPRAARRSSAARLLPARTSGRSSWLHFLHAAGEAALGELDVDAIVDREGGRGTDDRISRRTMA